VRITEITRSKWIGHSKGLLFHHWAYSPMEKTTFPNEKHDFSLGMVLFLQ